MKTKELKKKARKSAMPKVAKLFGDSTLESACSLWYYQPKVPAAMRKEKK